MNICDRDFRLPVGSRRGNFPHETFFYPGTNVVGGKFPSVSIALKERESEREPRAKDSGGFYGADQIRGQGLLCMIKWGFYGADQIRGRVLLWKKR